MNENKLVKQAWKNGQKINMIVMFFQYLAFFLVFI